MACCILAALIISEVLAFWRERRRIVLFAVLLTGTSIVFAWELSRHWEHVQAYSFSSPWSFLHPEDPAVRALQGPQVMCRGRGPDRQAVALNSSL